MIREGGKAPDFSLESDRGEKLGLSDYPGKTIVLYFYPKDMTPGCTTEACDFRDNVNRLKKLGAVVLGVSKDLAATHAKFQKKESLTFPLLSDDKGKVCELYGVWKEKSLYGRKYMGIERTTFVIGSDRKIRKIFSKVKVNGHVEEVLAYCKDMSS
jgi:peroxiredoxin Q/BCP